VTPLLALAAYLTADDVRDAVARALPGATCAADGTVIAVALVADPGGGVRDVQVEGVAAADCWRSWFVALPLPPHDEEPQDVRFRLAVDHGDVLPPATVDLAVRDGSPLFIHVPLWSPRRAEALAALGVAAPEPSD
jgi:hypothetical protein